MYDLRNPHLRIVGKGIQTIIVQDGVAYEHGSRRSLGPVVDVMKEKVVGKHDNKLCRHCGGSFTSASSLEEHFVQRHHDLILSSVSRHAPKGVKGIWTPTQDMIEEEAREMVASMLEGKEDKPAEKTTETGKTNKGSKDKPGVVREER